MWIRYTIRNDDEICRLFLRMEPDKLQCPWDGVNNIQTRFNAMLTQGLQKNELPSDVAQYDPRIINSNYNVLQE